MKQLSEKIINKHLQTKIGKKSEVIKSNYGGCVNVPAALVNHPRAFYRRQLVSKPGLRVWLNISYSAGFTADEVAKNIMAYIAFTRYLTKNYNVELKLVVSSNGAG